jgi:hypothetical protein
MSVKSIFKVANKFMAQPEEGEVRVATTNEITVHLASLVPGEKKGGILNSVRLNEATGNAEYRYAHTDEEGNVSYKIYAKPVLDKPVTAQNNSATQTEPVDGVQDEKKSKENKTNVPRDESKSKPEGDWDRPKGVDKPVEVRTENYQKGKGGEDTHTDVVPRSKNNSGLDGSDSTNFAEEGANAATSGNENSYVQNWDSPEKPTPAGNENNHAVAETDGAVKTASEDSPLPVEFATDLMGMGSGELVSVAGDDKDDKDLPDFIKEKMDNKKDADKDEENSDEDSEKSEDKDSKKEASVDEDVVNQLTEAKSQLEEVTGLLSQAKAETNKYKLREARMQKAIEYAHVLQRLNPVKYANANAFTTKVADTVVKMNVAAIEAAIEETNSAITEVVKAANKVNDSAKNANSSGDLGLQAALVVPRTTETWNDSTDKEALAEMLMANSQIGKYVAELETYKPHQRSNY